jgi:hypothetical protein
MEVDHSRHRTPRRAPPVGTLSLAADAAAVLIDLCRDGHDWHEIEALLQHCLDGVFFAEILWFAEEVGLLAATSRER